MQKKILGYSLLTIGLAVMGFAGYLFATGSGGRVNLLEVIGYMIFGAGCFFAGIHYVYDAAHSFIMEDEHSAVPELEEVSPIQQQWRTIHIAKHPSPTPAGNQMAPEMG